MRGKKFYEKYLPKGSTVEFQIGLQGAIIVNTMLAGKQHIGYVGDMPAIVSTTKQDVADIRMVRRRASAATSATSSWCATTRPQFANRPGGDQVAGRQASCGAEGKLHRPLRAGRCSSKPGIQPEAYLNQNIEVITSNFRAGKLDAAVIWEPTASRLVQDGLARKRSRPARSVNEIDGGFLGMRADLISSGPMSSRPGSMPSSTLSCSLPTKKCARDHQDGEAANDGIFRQGAVGIAVRRLPRQRGRHQTRVELPVRLSRRRRSSC